MQSKRATVFSPGNILPERFVSTTFAFWQTRALEIDFDRSATRIL